MFDPKEHVVITPRTTYEEALDGLTRALFEAGQYLGFLVETTDGLRYAYAVRKLALLGAEVGAQERQGITGGQQEITRLMGEALGPSLQARLEAEAREIVGFTIPKALGERCAADS